MGRGWSDSSALSREPVDIRDLPPLWLEAEAQEELAAAKTAGSAVSGTITVQES